MRVLVTGHAGYVGPVVADAINNILRICKEHNVPCGHPHPDAKNIERLVANGFRVLARLDREPIAAIEFPSRRSYILARRTVPSSHGHGPRA